MKKRTAFLGAILSLIPLGQPLIIKTGVVLSSSAVLFSLPEKVNAETAQFFLEKGIKEWLEGDNYAAISSYTKAIKLKPNFSNAYIARCGSFVNINRSKDAIKDCNKAISLGNFDSSVYRNLCGAHAQLEEYKIAEGFCDKAIKLDDRDEIAYLNRGLISMILNNKLDACSDWRNASSFASIKSVKKSLSELINDYC
tara:strand:+ start:141 stop:731 length:591 start_codon:yes stop_codon:yes gene_type:complete